MKAHFFRMKIQLQFCLEDTLTPSGEYCFLLQEKQKKGVGNSFCQRPEHEKLMGMLYNYSQEYLISFIRYQL